MSKDTIYREDAIKAYNEAMDELVKWQMEEWQLGDFSECEFNTTDCKHIVRKLEAIPSADRPQGEWVPFEYGDERWHKCTACGVADKYIEYVERPNGTTGKLVAIRNYCPNCGAHMKGADDE